MRRAWICFANSRVSRKYHGRSSLWACLLFGGATMLGRGHLVKKALLHSSRQVIRSDQRTRLGCWEKLHPCGATSSRLQPCSVRVSCVHATLEEHWRSHSVCCD